MRRTFTTISLLLALISFRTYAQTGWSYLPNAPISSRIDDLFFVNTDTGVAVDNYGEIYKTNDGGDTWSQKLASGYYMRSVEFLNDSVGFAGTLYNNFYKTTDGGDTWTDISNLLEPPVPGVCGLNAVDDSVVYGVGIWSEPAYVIKSTTSGLSWSHINMSSYAHGLVDCYFFSADTGFVTGIGLNEQATILYTDNGGITWQNKFTGNVYNSYAWKIQFLDRMNGVVCIASENLNSSSQMLVTSDGGMNWDLKTVSPNYNELEGIGFIDKAHGWVGGYLNGMYETIDTGTTWTYIPFGATVNRYFKVNDTLLYCSGESVYKFTDTLPPVFTSALLAPPAFVPIHTIDRVYPNPASDVINISYTLAGQTMVDLSMFDIAGKRVYRFVHDHQYKGSYNLQEEIKSLPSGKYFIMLNTNEGAVGSDFIQVAR